MEVLQSKCYIGPYTKFIFNENKAVITHIGSGKWIKLKSDILSFIKDNVNKGKSVQEIIDQGTDDYSKDYISNLLRDLVKNEMIDLDEEFRNNDNEVLKDIYVNLTNRCNLRCLHCSSCSGEYIKGELTFEEICKIIDTCCELKPEKLVLTGGELFVRKDAEEIIKYASNKFSGILCIMSNGVLIDDDRVKLISEYVGEVNLSLDGYNEETADYVRGKGVFNKVMEVIDKLQKASVNKISLSMVETKVTENHLKEFNDLCKKLNVRPMVRKFEPVGRGETNYDSLKTSVKTFSEEETLTQEEIKKLKTNITGKSLCNAGIRVLSIDHVGDVYPCEVLQEEEYRLGNILKDGINLDYSSPIQNLKTCVVDKIEGCKDCNVRYFCSSGCPKSDTTRYYNEEYKRKHCSQIKDIYNKIIWESN